MGTGHQPSHSQLQSGTRTQLSVKHCQISGQRVSSEPFKQTLPRQNWFLRQFSVILASCRGSEP